MPRASRQGHVQGFACHMFDMDGQLDNAVASLQHLLEGYFSLKLLVRGLATPNPGSTLHKCPPEKHPSNRHQQKCLLQVCLMQVSKPPGEQHCSIQTVLIILQPSTPG